MYVVLLYLAFPCVSHSHLIGEPSRTAKTLATIDDFPGSGVFLRNLGTMSTSSSTYKLIIPLPFQQLEESIQKVENEIHMMIATYNKSFNRPLWPDQPEWSTNDKFNAGTTKQRLLFETNMVYSRLIKMFESIWSEFFDIRNLFHEGNLPKRVPRGLLNFIGEGMEWLFGVVSESQLNKVKARVVQTESSEINVLQSIKNLATIVKSNDLEISNLEKSLYSLQNHTHDLIHQFKILIFGQATQKFEIFSLTLFERLYHFESQSAHTLDTLYRDINKLSQALKNAVFGHLDYNFMPPNILHQLLVDTQKFLPEHYVIPKITDDKNFFQIYKLLKVEIFNSQNETKYLAVNIPLINDNEVYQLNLATIFGVPFSPRSNVTAKINLDSNIIYAINLNNNKAFKFEYSLLKMAKQFDSHYYATFQNLTFVEQHSIQCLRAFQNGEFNSNRCTKSISSDILSSSLAHLEKDRWGFSVRGEEILEIACIQEGKRINNTKSLVLSGFGEVRIPLGCDIIFKNEQLTGIFIGSRKVDVPGISKILTINMPPASLAFSTIWSGFSENQTRWDLKNIKNIQKDLENEIGWQIRNTFLHNKTKNLLKKIKNLADYPLNTTVPFWFEPIEKKDGFLIGLALLSLILHFFTFFMLKSMLQAKLLNFLKRLT